MKAGNDFPGYKFRGDEAAENGPGSSVEVRLYNPGKISEEDFLTVAKC